MKKIYAVLIALLILVSPVTALAAKYEPPAEVYVADYANVIDSDVENYIVKTGAALCEKTGAQIVIMTVNFIDGDFEDFCYEIFNDWGIGDAKLNNGVLVVMSIGDQDAYCLQGAGLERSLTSGTITTMMVDYLYDDFMAGDYSIGAKHIFDAFKDWLCDYYDVTLTGSTSTGTNTSHGTSTTGTNTQTSGGMDSDFAAILGFIIFIVILVIVLRLIFRPRYRYSSNRYSNRYGRYGRGYDSHDYYNNNHTYGGSSHTSNHSSGSWWGSSGSSHSSGSSWGSSGSSHSSGSSGHSSSSHISHSSSSHSSGGSHSSGHFGGGGSRGGGGGFGKH